MRSGGSARPRISFQGYDTIDGGWIGTYTVLPADIAENSYSFGGCVLSLYGFDDYNKLISGCDLVSIDAGTNEVSLSADKLLERFGHNTFVVVSYGDSSWTILVEGNTTQPTTPAFSDVKAGDYFAEPVAWAVEKGITNGTSQTTFSPEKTCTQGQILTFLWRAKGEPAPAASVSDTAY